jgi:hypothetical protein
MESRFSAPHRKERLRWKNMTPQKNSAPATGRFTILLLLLVSLSSHAEAQIKLEPDQRYLLLATTRTGTMEKELDEAASLGFRVVASAPSGSNELIIFLEKSPQETQQYNYRLLATTRTGTMQEELDEGAAIGFRFLSRTPICKGSSFGSGEIVLAMEQTEGAVEPRYEYKLLATNRTSTLQREVSTSVSKGFSIAAIVSCTEHIIIMEREIT